MEPIDIYYTDTDESPLCITHYYHLTSKDGNNISTMLYDLCRFMYVYLHCLIPEGFIWLYGCI